MSQYLRGMSSLSLYSPWLDRRASPKRTAIATPTRRTGEGAPESSRRSVSEAAPERHAPLEIPRAHRFNTLPFTPDSVGRTRYCL